MSELGLESALEVLRVVARVLDEGGEHPASGERAGRGERGERAVVGERGERGGDRGDRGEREGRGERATERVIERVIEAICVGLGWAYGEAWLFQPAGPAPAPSPTAPDPRAIAASPARALQRGPRWYADRPGLSAFSHAVAVWRPAPALAKLASDRRAVVWSHEIDADVRGLGGAYGLTLAFAVPIAASGPPAGALAFYLADPAPPEREALLVGLAAAGLGRWFERERTESALRAGEQRLRLLLDHAGDATVLLDAAGRIAEWPPAAERLIGDVAADVIGTLPVELSTRVTPNAPATLVDLGVAAIHGRHETVGWRPRKDGSRFWARLVTCPIRAAHGEVTGFALFVRDESAVHSLDQALLDQARLVERERRELAAVAAAATHDLGAPLHELTQRAELLLAPGALDEAARAHAAAIRDSAQRALRFAGGLGALARAGAEAEPVHLVIDLGELAREAATALGPELRAASVRLELGELPMVPGRPVQLQRLLHELIATALAASGAPSRIAVTGRRLTAVTSDDLERTQLVIESDQPAAADPRLGLGLVICRRIIEGHGGELAIRSAPGEALAFTITLPALRPVTTPR